MFRDCVEYGCTKPFGHGEIRGILRLATMPKPLVSAELLASLGALVPPRITKRLDANPRAAESWIATEGPPAYVVATDGEDRVTVTGDVVRSLDQVACTCLLSPRCFHTLAVLSILPLGERAEQTAALLATPPSAAPEEADAITLDAAQRAAAERALGVVRTIIAGGLANVSTARLGELLRAVHEARRQSLPRLEAALLAVIDDVRRLRERDPDFVLAEAADALGRLWLLSSLLSRGETHHRGGSLVGTARRAYRERRGLRLTGIGTEPVLATGYAGVVSRFTNGREVFSAVELWPGDDERAAAALSAQLRFGEISIAHRDVLGTTLLFALARTSDDGRLGAGKDVTAARAPLDEGPRETFFASPLERQMSNVLDYTPLANQADEQPIVLTGRFVDRGGPALALPGGAFVPLEPAIDHPRFTFRENLALLARAQVSARVVSKLRVQGASLRLAPLTVFPSPELPRSISSAFDLGFERRARADLPAGDLPPLDREATSAPDVLAALRARVLRWALGGTATLPSAALPLVETETATLRRALLPTIASVATRLATGASEGVEGSSDAWAAALFALRAAERTIANAALEVASAPSG